jgi:DNA-binding MarR family transcriptional regulator
MSSPPISALTDHLGYWLRYVSNHVSQSFARKLEGEGVTVAEWAVLRELYDGDGLAPSRVAEQLGMTRGAITKLADRLIDKALLTRDASTVDGRAQILVLTPGGRALVPRLSALADRNDAEFFEGLSAGEREMLERVLRGIVERAGLTTIPVD